MKIVTLHYDQDAECPCDNDCQWKLVSFNHRHINYQDPDKYLEVRDGEVVGANIGLRRKLEVGTAFILSYFEHGEGAWSLKGEGTQCRWDTAQIAGVLLWEHPVNEMGSKTYEERAEDARKFLEVYNEWANGHCYGYSIEEEVTLPCGHTETKDLDSCFGFIGDDYMLDQVKELVAGDAAKVNGEAAWLANYHPISDNQTVIERR